MNDIHSFEDDFDGYDYCCSLHLVGCIVSVEDYCGTIYRIQIETAVEKNIVTAYIHKSDIASTDAEQLQSFVGILGIDNSISPALDTLTTKIDIFITESSLIDT